MSSPLFPERPSHVQPTSIEACDEAVRELRRGAPIWAAMDCAARARMMRSMIPTLRAEAEAWVASACRGKGYAPGSGAEGEEWVNGVMCLARNLRLFAESLEQGGQPKLPAVRETSDGQKVVRVFPANAQDRVLLTGYEAEIWIEPGRSESCGAIYRAKAAGAEPTGGVALVLGAGNQASIAPMDVLHKLVVEDEVCILKMNPVNDYLGVHFERALAPLVEAGFLRIVYGGAEVGQHLCNHPQVDSIHITGSDRTHDLIVWGNDPAEIEQRKASGERKNLKPITSELGAVSPIIVVPGSWSNSDLDFQARQVTSMVVQNASFNCNAGKVLILSDSWPQRQEFLERMRHHLRAAPLRKAHYPGAQQRYQAFLDQYPTAEPLGERSEDVVPWTLVHGVGTGPAEYATQTEAFCGILAVVELPSRGPSSYIDAVIPFVNDTLWGTLSCNLIVDPETERKLGGRVARAIAELRYGAIGVNCWSGLVYGLANTTWGAFPGHPLEDIQSGRGTVHNSFLLDHPQKSVCRAPWRIRPTPAWFVDHKNLKGLAKAMLDYEAKPSWWKIPSVAVQAFQG